MTLDERIVVEAYTGYVMTGGQDNPKENGLCHKYIEQKMGRPVWTHEFAFKEVQEQVRKTALPDFLKLCRGEEVKLNLE